MESSKPFTNCWIMKSKTLIYSHFFHNRMTILILHHDVFFILPWMSSTYDLSKIWRIFCKLYKYSMILGSRLWLRIPDYTLLLCLEFWLWTLMLTIQAAFWPEELTKLLRFSIRMMNRFVFLIRIWFWIGIFVWKIRENAMNKSYFLMSFLSILEFLSSWY